MTTTTLPRLPRRTRTRTRTHSTTSSPWTPPGGWARPTPAALRAIEAALAQWSA
ncbi:hypothetical protein [Streptomyces mirabilis]|uniref:Uncharacterized protein n=1 Tax=Streptomyces mirabilis TaxID=68239 RepID=A0A1I2FTD7_9ACTN|nr:hypothetical protein [Streptomyces mirabilis]SFF07711.1 hypothetical protein SAMN02787118_103609 [Streptomyces mirabilis]